MEISISEAKARLTELVRQAEAGEEVILTRHGKAVARLEPVRPAQSREERLAIIKAIQAQVAASGASPGPDGARSQDYLYDEFGLPK